MTKEEKNKYLEAVDLVCINCIYKNGDEIITTTTETFNIYGVQN